MAPDVVALLAAQVLVAAFILLAGVLVAIICVRLVDEPDQPQPEPRPAVPLWPRSTWDYTYPRYWGPDRYRANDGAPVMGQP